MQITATVPEILALLAGIAPTPRPEPAVQAEELQNRLRAAMMYHDVDTPAWMEGYPLELD